MPAWYFHTRLVSAGLALALPEAPGIIEKQAPRQYNA